MIVCIDNEDMCGKLTIGKIYEGVFTHYSEIWKCNFFTIIDDNGYSAGLRQFRFKPLSQIREEKLNQIL